MSDLVVPSSFCSVRGLGEPISVYMRRRRSNGCGLIVCIVGLLLALGAAYCSLAAYPGIVSSSSDVTVPFVFGSFNLLLLLGMALFAWWTVARWNEAAVVYREGLAYFDGRRMHAVAWDEVTSVLISVIRHTHYSVIPIVTTSREYTLTNQEGTRFKLSDSLSNDEELFKQIHREVFPHTLARAQQAFDSGQPIQFGPLSVSKTHGVEKGKRCYPWHDIAAISMSRGWVHIKLRRGDRFTSIQARVSKVPNVHVFLKISTSMVE